MRALEGRDKEAVVINHSNTLSPPAQSPPARPPPAWLGVPVVSHGWLEGPVARGNAKSKDTADRRGVCGGTVGWSVSP